MNSARTIAGSAGRAGAAEASRRIAVRAERAVVVIVRGPRGGDGDDCTTRRRFSDGREGLRGLLVIASLGWQAGRAAGWLSDVSAEGLRHEEGNQDRLGELD